ncbi:hypothetical protein FDC58_16875 [Clostridium botulinum]|uniref:hypothetical protein n=1 Tax=Clostridium TaxID=1485 RepID=UPI000CF693BD|nr:MULTISPECIES: hypothetical protein [Clostridium]MBY7009024.1 hypothetical protein [Clostridium botulinum]NFG31433.1 hypothetical protein [Clostridium botulinum]NFH73778.1 hypothetical protein [Clostridium botulinum]NFI02031.1 hypothetical protein [Clostridium botulinum]NFI64366.1 hypothetical protein [Clostridium botulinum]
MKDYKTNNDYILDVLEIEEDKLFEELYNNISDKLRVEFARFVAIKDTILKLNIEKDNLK